MARGDYPSSKQDQFVLRFPAGLRDRVKAYAERHGRSMNTEIIRILEREFPEPWSLDQRVHELMHLIEVMRIEGVNDDTVFALNYELLQTAKGIASGRVKGVSDEVRAQIRERLADVDLRNFEDESNRYTQALDDEEAASFDRTGIAEKFVDPEFPDPDRKD